MLLIVPGWVALEQFWMALSTNIMFAVNYPHPFYIWPLFYLLDNTTLLIHEAGHTIFGLFQWRFLTVLGGTLLQMILPLLIFILGWTKEKRLIAQSGLFWLGYSWLDSAAYCADAYHQQLPLIGNLPKSAHDFSNILSSLNILDHYFGIAWTMYTIGLLILIASLVWPLKEYFKREFVYISLGL